MTDSSADGPKVPAEQHASDQRTPAEQRMREALGPEIGSDVVEAAGAIASPPPMSSRRWMWTVLAIFAIVVLQFVALFVVPPYACEPGVTPCQPAVETSSGFSYPGDAILANFELPAPHVVVNLSGEELSTDILTVQASITNTLLTGWIIMGAILVLAVVLSRNIRVVPRTGQNALEYVYEALANFATSLGGPAARVYVPVFVTFFLFILLSNWSGLLPFVGRTEELRAPTSDVNVTIGLAIVAFSMFHIEGVRRLGFRGYFGKFFSLKAFKDGIGAGLIGLFVGVLEFFLEFVKPVTLSMRLFGNIYAGEVALGVISALTIFMAPVIMLLLEGLLNFMQALIFSVLALMFTLTAIESHDEHEEAHPELPEGNIAPDMHPRSAAA